MGLTDNNKYIQMSLVSLQWFTPNRMAITREGDTGVYRPGLPVSTTLLGVGVFVLCVRLENKVTHLYSEAVDSKFNRDRGEILLFQLKWNSKISSTGAMDFCLSLMHITGRYWQMQAKRETKWIMSCLVTNKVVT